ncbi:MAG: hypothetical protein EA342_00665 [Leptolyngbya sp. LCM1.Bin17]|nr:MAG: hypothetical protein EA342_00665 [Leptolyngbya sp. LCM1.Bin17]
MTLDPNDLSSVQINKNATGSVDHPHPQPLSQEGEGSRKTPQSPSPKRRSLLLAGWGRPDNAFRLPFLPFWEEGAGGWRESPAPKGLRIYVI